MFRTRPHHHIGVSLVSGLQHISCNPRLCPGDNHGIIQPLLAAGLGARDDGVLQTSLCARDRQSNDNRVQPLVESRTSWTLDVVPLPQQLLRKWPISVTKPSVTTLSESSPHGPST